MWLVLVLVVRAVGLHVLFPLCFPAAFIFPRSSKQYQFTKNKIKSFLTAHDVWERENEFKFSGI